MSSRRGAAFVLHELLQNCYDTGATNVDVHLTPIDGVPFANLQVEDDCPNGFADLSHAFTLFAESAKRGDAVKRGRFNLGEKLVLACCREAEIVSTKGGVRFDDEGRHTLRRKREAGSLFSATIRLTREQLADIDAAVTRILPPAGVRTTYNGQVVAPRGPLAVVTATLPTELAGPEGTIRRSERQTQVEIHPVAAGEVASIFEMGIPIVETNDRWHVNVLQKVPLAFERDNVTPAYLARIRALVLAEMATQLSSREEASASWVRDAVQTHGASMPAAAIRQVLDLRFGTQRVAFDPSDPEANKIATAAGYTVVSGGALSAPEWAAARRTGTILPAGQVTPSPKPYSDQGLPLRLLAEHEWSESIQALVAYSKRLGQYLVGSEPQVRIGNDPSWPFAATYGPGPDGGAGSLTLNLGRLGHAWFEGPLESINDLLIHEFGHHFCGDHLSRDYYRALTRLGAKMVDLALTQPHLFEISRPAVILHRPVASERTIKP